MIIIIILQSDLSKNVVEIVIARTKLLIMLSAWNAGTNLHYVPIKNQLCIICLWFK